MKSFDIGGVKIGLDADLFFMAGPCVIESQTECIDIAKRLKLISEKTGVGVIFKASFDKANRSSIKSYRGPGLSEGLKILAKVRDVTGLPIMTDIHESCQAVEIGKVVDCLQVPAFLCRQTDLLAASAATGKPVAVKKGQFVSPDEMTNVVGKLKESGCDKIMLTERGTFFGYNRLVNDMAAISQMAAIGCPVIFDATHSTQRPGGQGDSSGGMREMAPILARSAVAAGANGLFIETHPEPEKSKCDAACMMPLDWVQSVIEDCKAIHEIVNRES
jgi:2-dehydro-3-deoxyphosphooctonate aldolase (KDO 8-P synthase)